MRLLVGRIARPHGVRGEVALDVRTDDPARRFAVGAELFTDERSTDERGPLRIASTRAHSGRWLVTFEGVADRTAAQSLGGTLLFADVDETERPDDPDEFYDHQLIGLTAVTTEGEVIGDVTEVLHLPGQDVLAITSGEREVLVPFVAAIVPSIEPEEGRLVVDPPPGLLGDQGA